MPSKTEKHPDWLARFTAFVALIGVVISYAQYNMDKKVAKLHLDPVVECFLEPDESKGNDIFKFTVRNSGPINAVWLSVDHFQRLFNVKTSGPGQLTTTGVSDLDPPGSNWLYAAELQHMQKVHKKVFSMLRAQEELSNIKKADDLRISDLEDYLDILYFGVTYFRESDGKKYEKRCIFFIDKERVYSERQLQNRQFYPGMMENIEDWIRVLKRLPISATKGG